MVEVAGLLQGLEPGVAPGLHRRDHRELGAPVQAAGLDPLEDLGRLDRDPAGDLDRRGPRPSRR